MMGQSNPEFPDASGPGRPSRPSEPEADAGTDLDGGRKTPLEAELERVKRLVEAAPEIRQDRVEAARRALRDGTLKLQGTDLVDKLLRDPLPPAE